MNCACLKTTTKNKKQNRNPRALSMRLPHPLGQMPYFSMRAATEQWQIHPGIYQLTLVHWSVSTEYFHEEIYARWPELLFLSLMHKTRQPCQKDLFHSLSLILIIRLGSRSIHTKGEDARKQNRVSCQYYLFYPKYLPQLPGILKEINEPWVMNEQGLFIFRYF